VVRWRRRPEEKLALGVVAVVEVETDAAESAAPEKRLWALDRRWDSARRRWRARSLASMEGASSSWESSSAADLAMAVCARFLSEGKGGRLDCGEVSVLQTP